MIDIHRYSDNDRYVYIYIHIYHVYVHINNLIIYQAAEIAKLKPFNRWLIDRQVLGAIGQANWIEDLELLGSPDRGRVKLLGDTYV